MKVLDFFKFVPTLRTFSGELLKGLSRTGVRGWTLNPEKEQLVHEDGMVLNLVNFYSRYVNSRRADRSRVIQECLAMAAAIHLEIPISWSAAKDAVCLAVRSRFDHATIDVDYEMRPNIQTQPVGRPLAGDLEVRLVYDFGTHLSHLTETKMKGWGESEDVVFDQALKNLAKIELPQWVPIGEGVFQLDSTDCYAESFMLLVATSETLSFAGNEAMIAPNRGVLLAADRGNDSALMAMVGEATRLIQTKPWPMSGTVLVRDGSAWKEFFGSGELAKKIHVLRTLNMRGVYMDQKTALDDINAQKERDIFVASYFMLEREGGLMSWSSLSEGIATLLPRSDIVVIGRSDGGNDRIETIPVLWDDAERILGSQLEATRLSPPRYLTNVVPDTAKWAELRAARIEL